jgi:hypothetical protein
MFVMIGENDFFGVPFPLVLANRFFHVYRSSSGYKLDVFRWDEESQQTVYDMMDSVIQVDEVGAKPTGTVKFSEPAEGVILYQFRPRPGIYPMFGKVPIKGEFEVRINNQSIIVSIDGNQIAELDNNTATGSIIGLFIGADGSFKMGSDRLPDGMTLVRNKPSGIKNSFVVI